MLGGKATDVALPADVPLIDVLPVILPQFGAEWVEQGADHEGWLLQRVGQEPLDEDRTATELNLLDGETVHLRPRADELAAIDYDDLVDGVGEQVREHKWAWKPGRSRWMFRIGSAVSLLLGLILLPGMGSPGVQSLLAGVLAVLLLGSAVLVSRGAAEPVAATILAGSGVCYAAVSGWLLMAAVNPRATVMMLLTSCAVLALMALAAAIMAVASAKYVFTGAVLCFGILALTGVIGSVAPVSAPEAAAVGVVLSMIVGVWVPATSFRLSGLSLPHLPTEPEQLSTDIEPFSERTIIDRGPATFAYSMSLFIGLGLAQSILMPMLVVEGYGWSMVLSLVIALLMLIRARHPDGTAQRWAVVIPAVVGVAANVAHIAMEHTDLVRGSFVVIPLFLLGIVLLLFSKLLPELRFRPYWGRVVEIMETLVAIAVVPILLQVFGVYMWMRGLMG